MYHQYMFNSTSGALTFSGVAVAMPGGRSTALAAGTSDDAIEQKVPILNAAIAEEHEAGA